MLYLLIFKINGNHANSQFKHLLRSESNSDVFAFNSLKTYFQYYFSVIFGVSHSPRISLTSTQRHLFTQLQTRALPLDCPLGPNSLQLPFYGLISVWKFEYPPVNAKIQKQNIDKAKEKQKKCGIWNLCVCFETLLSALERAVMQTPTHNSALSATRVDLVLLVAAAHNRKSNNTLTFAYAKPFDSCVHGPTDEG